METQTRPRGWGMRLDELLALPVSMDIVTAGKAFGMGRTKAHQLARNDEFPCEIMRVGRSYRVTRAAVLRALGIE